MALPLLINRYGGLFDEIDEMRPAAWSVMLMILLGTLDWPPTSTQHRNGLKP
jgi:hypothetical protein